MHSEEFDVFKLFYILKKRAKLLLVIFPATFSAVFIYLVFFYATEFRANFVAYSSVLDTKILIANINAFQNLIDLKDFTSLSRNLKITPGQAETLTYLNANEIKSGSGSENVISVMIMGKDSVLLQSIVINIQQYFTEGIFFNQSKEFVEDNLVYAKSKITQELEEDVILENNNQLVIINKAGDIPALLLKKQQIDLDLATFSTFSNIGSVNISQPKNSLPVNFLVSLLASLAIAVIIIWLIEFFLFLNVRMQSYDRPDLV